MGLGGQCHAWLLYSWERNLVPIVQEARQAPGPVWMGAENLTPHQESIPFIIQPVASCYTDYTVSQSNEFCNHNPLCCFSVHVYCHICYVCYVCYV